jgi:hypothetical protein
MKKPSLTETKKICKALSKLDKKKYISLDMLSRQLGIYSDVLGDQLEFFNPMVQIDASFNMKDLLPTINEYIETEEQRLLSLPKEAKRKPVTKKEVKEFPTIGSFVYTKMTGAGGLVDPTNNLDDHDLFLLKRLVDQEINNRKRAKRKKHLADKQ